MAFTQIKIEELTEQLLQKYECVILPGFGGFIVRDVPCSFNADKSQIKPSARHIFFNPHLTQNDGLLQNAIQNGSELTFSEASEACNKAIDELKKEILNEGSKHFGKLGSFYKGQQDNIWFAPSPSLNLSIDSYGLDPLDIHPIEIVEKAVESETLKVSKPVPVREAVMEADRKPIEELDTPKPGLRPWLIAASIALIVHFVYLGLEKTPEEAHQASVIPEIEISNDNGVSMIDTSSELIPELPLDTATYQITEPEIAQVVEETPAAEETAVLSEAAPVEVPKEKIEVQQTETPAPVASEPVQSDILIAKYKLEVNANFHVKDLIKEGKSARVEFKEGWYEVLSPSDDVQ